MSFKATVNADISNFEKNLSQAQKSIDNFAQKVGKQLDKVGDSFIKAGKVTSVFSGAVAGVTAAIGALAISTANYTKDLDSLSTITGISTDMLQEYELIALKATVPTDALAQATMSLTRRLKDVSEDGGGATEVLKTLGVSLKNTDGSMKSAGKVTEDAIFALSGLEGGLEASALGVQLFGRQWNNVTQIVDLGADEISRLKDEAHDLGLVLSEDAIKGSAEFGIAVDVLKSRISALKNQIGAALAPMLTDTLLPLIEKKIMPAFQKFAENIKGLIERFNDLSPKTKALIAGITGLAIAVGPLLVALGGLLKLLPLLIGSFGALIGPVGLIVAAVAGAAVLIIKNWDSIVDYFTIGDGAVFWHTIKNDAIDLHDSLKTTFEQIKGTITNIWESMTFEVEEETENLFEIIARGASNTYLLWSNLWKDFKKARASETLGEELRNIGTMFKNFGIGLVTDVVEPVNLVVKDLTNKQQEAYNAARGLGDGIAEVGDESKKTTPEIDALNKEIERLKNSSKTPIIPKGSLKELSEKIKVLYEQLDNETTQIGRIKVSKLIKELEQKVVRIKVSIEAANTKIEGVTVGTIDAPAIDINPLIDKASADMSRLKSVIDDANQELAYGVQMTNQMLVGGFIGVFEGLGNAIGSGENVLGALGKSLIGALGDMAIQVGTLMIGFGSAAEALWKLISSPFGAVAGIAAGAALIALGAAAKSAVSGAISSGGGGGSSSGGYSSTRINSAPQMGEFEIRDPYRNDKVKFEISGENLVGIYERQNEKALRNV